MTASQSTSTVKHVESVSTVETVMDQLNSPLTGNGKRAIRFMLPRAKMAVASREETKVKFSYRLALCSFGSTMIRPH